MGNTLRWAGLCQDKHLDFSRPCPRLPWDTLTWRSPAGPCGWWQKYGFGAAGWWDPPFSRGRIAERKSPVSRSLVFVLSQRGLSSLICINKLLQWRVQLIPAEGLLLQLKPIPQPSTDCTGKMMFSCSLFSFFSFVFDQCICLCSGLQEGRAGCERNGTRTHPPARELRKPSVLCGLGVGSQSGLSPSSRGEKHSEASAQIFMHATTFLALQEKGPHSSL